MPYCGAIHAYPRFLPPRCLSVPDSQGYRFVGKINRDAMIWNRFERLPVVNSSQNNPIPIGPKRAGTT
jgi:hypothetical protein